jgi:FtsH-binding integral membrane protein
MRHFLLHPMSIAWFDVIAVLVLAAVGLRMVAHPRHNARRNSAGRRTAGLLFMMSALSTSVVAVAVHQVNIHEIPSVSALGIMLIALPLGLAIGCLVRDVRANRSWTVLTGWFTLVLVMLTIFLCVGAHTNGLDPVRWTATETTIQVCTFIMAAIFVVCYVKEYRKHGRGATAS